MFDFHHFDAEMEELKDGEWVEQLPKMSKDVIQEMLEVKEVNSRRGNLYKRFLIKWLGKPTSEATWISEDELK